MQNTAVRKRNQVPEVYLVIGIDLHKRRHAAVIMTQDFNTHGKFKFNNSKEGFEMALERIRMEMVRTGSRGVIFAIKTGGHYWCNLAYFLDERGIPFRFINQSTLKRRREGKALNHRKNDYRDGEVAAQLLRTGEFTETGNISLQCALLLLHGRDEQTLCPTHGLIGIIKAYGELCKDNAH